MKLITSIFLTLTLLAMGQSAFAQSAKDVNVVNTPNVSVVTTPFAGHLVGCEQQNSFLQCFLDIPAGKVFVIDKISGWHAPASTEYIQLLISTLQGNFSVHLNTTLTGSTFEATGPVYVIGTDSYSDSFGVRHDLAVGLPNGSGININNVSVVGHLLDNPTP